jgi:xanthine/uracil permease
MENNLKVQDPDFKKKLVKYLLFGLIIGISVRYIPNKQIDNNEILIIAAIASITFGIIDMYSPSIEIK